MFQGDYNLPVMKSNNEQHISHFIQGVCKGKSKEEQRQAELNFLRFIRLAERVNNRLYQQEGTQ